MFSDGPVVKKGAIVPAGMRLAPRQQQPEVVGKKFPSNLYVDIIARYPTLALVLAVIPPLVIMFIAVSSINDVDVRPDGFTIRDHPVVRDATALRDMTELWSRTQREGNFTSQSALANAQRSQPKYRVELQFVLNLARLQAHFVTQSGGTNQSLPDSVTLLSEEALTLVRDVEIDARTSLYYTTLCLRNDLKGGEPSGSSTLPCVPPVSVTTYFFPGSPVNDREWPMSGDGATFQEPREYTINRLKANPQYKWFMGRGLTQLNPRVVLLRSQFVFGWPIRSSSGGFLSESQYEDLLRDFVNDFRGKLQRRLDARTFATSGIGHFVDVVLGGDQVEEAKLMAALDDEYFRVPVAALIVIFFLYLHSRSGVITGCAVVQLLLTYLVATGLMSMGQRRIPLLSSISMYVIITFGLDGTMIYYDTFLHSGFMPTTGRRNMLTVPQRMAYTMRKAGTGVIMANLVALGAFATNTASAIPAVADFGTLMVIVCLTNMYMAVTYSPAYILFHHYYFSKRRRNLQRQKEILMRQSAARKRNELLQSTLALLERTKPATEVKYAALREAHAAVKKLRYIEMQLIDDFSEKTMKLRNEITGAISAIGHSLEQTVPRASVNGGAGGEGGFNEADAFDASAFAEVGGSAKGKPGVVVVPYTSSRMISNSDIVHIPPAMCFRSQRTAEFIAELLGAIAAENAAAAPPPLVPGTPRGAADPDIAGLGALAAAGSSPGGGLEDIEDVEVVSVSGTSPGSPTLRRGGAGAGGGDGAGDDKRPPSMVESMPDPSTLTDEAMDAFLAKWGAIAEQIEVLPGDGKTAELAPLMAYLVCCGHDPAHVVSNAPSEFFTSPKRALAAIAAQSSAGFVAAPIVDHDSSQQRARLSGGGGVCGRVSNWWAERGKVKRKWCCGRFGKRVGETQEEKDARIMAKKVKHEGYGRVERFFLNVWAPLVHTLRIPVTWLTLIAIVIFSIFAAQVQHGPVSVQLLKNDDSVAIFERNRGLFQIGGTCDYCSAYYRDPNEFYLISPDAVAICRHQGYPPLMHAWVDDCGVCFGSGNCKDCRGNRNGTFALNSCGECLDNASSTAAASSDCGKCTSAESCGYCAYQLGLPNMYGPGCSVRCDDTTCPPSRGRCHPFTGACECHASQVLGYFAGPRCERCVSGFFPAVDESHPNARACHMECNISAGPACGCQITGRCSRCPRFYFGNNCNEAWIDACGPNGQLSASGGCSCFSSFMDGDRCQRQDQCSYHGALLTNETAPFTGCGCRGNWVGNKCQFCACYNGGRCNEEGQCICSGGWTGPRCRSCSATCSKHGYCPEPWEVAHYSQRECVALFCPRADIDAGVVCVICRRITLITPTCAPFNADGGILSREFGCSGNPECHWYDGRCYSVYPAISAPVSSVQCSCKGVWSGDQCQICNPPVKGLICLDDGRVEGCDGNAVDVRPGATYAVEDACGVCKGNGDCISCDGIVGGTATFDSCGVCNGNNECLSAGSAGSKVRGTVNFVLGVLPLGSADGGFVWDPAFDATKRSTQLTMQQLCQELADSFADFVVPVNCPIWAFVAWSLDRNVGFTWLTDSANVTRALFHFARETGRFDQFGFSSNSVDDPSLRLLWMKVECYSRLDVGASPEDLQRERTAVMQLKLRPGLANVLITNSEWTPALSKQLAITGIRYALGVGAAVMVAILAIMTCSATLTLCAATCVAVVVLFTLSVIRWCEWGAGPIEQICMSILLGMASQHVVHMIEGYLDTVHGTQSHLFAREITTLTAVKGALVRSGLSVTTSSVAVAIVSLIFIGSHVTVFQRAAEIIITINLSSAFAALVLLAGLLALMGPQQTWRHWSMSLIWFAVLAALAGIILLIIFLAGGVEGPQGDKVLRR